MSNVVEGGEGHVEVALEMMRCARSNLVVLGQAHPGVRDDECYKQIRMQIGEAILALEAEQT